MGNFIESSRQWIRWNAHRIVICQFLENFDRGCVSVTLEDLVLAPTLSGSSTMVVTPSVLLIGSVLPRTLLPVFCLSYFQICVSSNHVSHPCRPSLRPGTAPSVQVEKTTKPKRLRVVCDYEKTIS